jgi:glucose/arabinose dehydrogenase
MKIPGFDPAALTAMIESTRGGLEVLLSELKGTAPGSAEKTPLERLQDTAVFLGDYFEGTFKALFAKSPFHDVPTTESGTVHARVALGPGIPGAAMATSITAAHDGTGRLLLTEKAGKVRVLEAGRVLDAPVLDLTGKVSSAQVERGLWSVAVDPGFANNGYLYVCYSRRADVQGLGEGDIVVERYHVPPGQTQADPSSVTPVITVPHPTYPTHHGGQLQFGPDGHLYLSTGDGGLVPDESDHSTPLERQIAHNPQDPESLLGKILRLDVRSTGPGVGYTVPQDNPLVGVPGRDEIWASGLRNPFHFSFDPAGNLFIGDVGASTWEEINLIPAGAPGLNFGWRVFEGPDAKVEGAPALTAPIYAYTHRDGNTAVMGGHVYRGEKIPGLRGAYVFGDLGGNIWALKRNTAGFWERNFLLQGPGGLTGFGEDEAGELYTVDLGGEVHPLLPG